MLGKILLALILVQGAGNAVNGAIRGHYRAEGYEAVRQEIGVAGNGIYGVQIVNIALREKEKLITIKPDGGAADDIVDNELGRNYPKKAIHG
jgi:hypothetical protein